MDEYPAQSTGFISRLKNLVSNIDQRTAFDTFIVVLILIGLAVSVYLAGQRQIFRSRAAQEGSAQVVDQNGQPIEQKEGDATVVETQQIRIKIDFPTEWNSQGFVPVNSAYAQSSQCDGNIYSCSDIKCPDGSTAPGTGCYEAGGDPNNRYRTECLRNCPASNIQPAPTPTSISTQQESCGLPWNGQPTQCSASDDLSNCTYLSSWSRPLSTVCGETTPFCWACPESAQAAPPEQPTSPPPQTITQPPQGEAQSPTPTPEPEEATQSVRISLNKALVQKDAPCAESSNPSETCKEISVLDLGAKGNIIDWQLPSQEGIYPLYVGFISSKGNYKETSLTVSYKTSTSTVSDEKKNDEEGGFLRLFSFQKGKSGETKIKGKLVVLHGDNLHTQQSFRNFLIQHVDQDGVLKYYNLKFKESNTKLPQSGDEVELEGNLEGQIFTVNRVLTQVSTPATTSTQDDSGYVFYPQPLAASGGKKALITYVRWSDNNQQYFSGDLVRDSILENSAYIASSSRFLRDASFGNNLHIAQLDFSQTEITVPVSGMACAPLGLGLVNILTAIDTATRLGGGYDIYIYLLAGPNNCPFLGAVPALPPVRILMNNYFDPQKYSNMSEQKRREDFSQTIVHEAGHTFGLQHASRIDCKNNGVSVSISRNCQIIEYGDSSSVMGSRYTFLSTVQDFYLGWLPQNDIEKLPYSSERIAYEKTITAVESSMPGKKLLVAQGLLSGGLSFLPFNDLRSPLRPAYYISFRKRTQSVFTGNPYPMPDDFYQGATIQIGPDSSVAPNQVFLINTSAGLQGDYTLKNGKNFYDSEQRILIEQVRKDDDTVTVRVTYNSDPPPSLPSISGKLKIIANGQKYKDVWISVFKIKSENPVEFGDLLADYRSLGFAAALPTDQDQEISFSIPNLTESKYALVPNLMTEGGRHISARSAEICPSSPAGPFSCLVNTGSTDLTFTLTISQ